jgi:hypothetical protein
VNSDKAADVRDSLNALPCVAHDIEPNEYSSDRVETRRGGVEVVFTGEHVHLKDYRFTPAEINEAGKIGFGDDPAMRPMYEVVLSAITLPGDTHAFVPRDVVFEAAKHDCLIRCEEDGTLRLRDDLQHREESDADGDACEECGCNRWRLQDGVPKCERCGATAEIAVEESTHEMTISDFE